MQTQTGKMYMGEPKTEAGTRTLYLPPNALAALAAHLRDFVGPNKNAWLFPGQNGEPRNPKSFTRLWNKARDAIGRPELHYHDLRRSGLTWAAQTGATNAELMHRGGHANVASVMILSTRRCGTGQGARANGCPSRRAISTLSLRTSRLSGEAEPTFRSASWTRVPPTRTGTQYLFPRRRDGVHVTSVGSAKRL